MADSTAPHPSEPQDSAITITISYKSQPHVYTFPQSATVSDLSQIISDNLSIPPHLQKLLAPKLGLLKDPEAPLAPLDGKKVTLLGATVSEVSAVNAAAAKANAPRARPTTSRGRPAPRDWRRDTEETIYTFQQILPLKGLPHPERSVALMERLRDDAGIKAIMRKYQWTVPILTEMDPASNTSHDSKLLGLNRNKGEVIELRLRTDDYGGYRDYKTIRRTLIHELTHNVHSEHDRKFFDLMAVLEKEAAKGNWMEGGRRLTEEVFYDSAEAAEEFHADGGGWKGGEYVLGGSRQGMEGMSRREVMARAAEERARREREVGEREKKRREE